MRPGTLIAPSPILATNLKTTAAWERLIPDAGLNSFPGSVDVDGEGAINAVVELVIFGSFDLVLNNLPMNEPLREPFGEVEAHVDVVAVLTEVRVDKREGEVESADPFVIGMTWLGAVDVDVMVDIDLTVVVEVTVDTPLFELTLERRIAEYF